MLKKDERLDIGKLENHNIYAQQTGQSVPLKQIADMGILWQPAEIIRRNRLKTVTIQADVASEVTPIAVSNIMDQWLKKEMKISVVTGLLITRSYFGFMTINQIIYMHILQK